MNYQILATDMDGTVVCKNNEIPPVTAEAMHKAMAKGYEVLFATGRCPAEVRPFLAQFPDMHYAICTNGSLILDLRSGKPLYSVVLDPEVVEQVLEAVRGMDLSAAFYIGDNFYVDAAIRGNLAYYNCDCFTKLFEECATWVEDPYAVFLEQSDCVRKVNLFFHNPEEHRLAAEKLARLPVSYPCGIPYDYEICPPGLTKGTGLEMLCELLGIPIQQAIACGDEGNDWDMVRRAGLGVAVGNASDAVKEVADLIVADCDQGGVAEVIERYLCPTL